MAISSGSQANYEKIRHGQEGTLHWERPTAYTALVGAFTPLVQLKADPGKTLSLYGFEIMAEEPNNFWVIWLNQTGLTYTGFNIFFQAPGVVALGDSPVKLGTGYSVTGVAWSIEILATNPSTDPAAIYQAALLVMENTIASPT